MRITLQANQLARIVVVLALASSFTISAIHAHSTWSRYASAAVALLAWAWIAASTLMLIFRQSENRSNTSLVKLMILLRHGREVYVGRQFGVARDVEPERMHDLIRASLSELGPVFESISFSVRQTPRTESTDSFVVEVVLSLPLAFVVKETPGIAVVALDSLMMEDSAIALFLRGYFQSEIERQMSPSGAVASYYHRNRHRVATSVVEPELDAVHSG